MNSNKAVLQTKFSGSLQIETHINVYESGESPAHRAVSTGLGARSRQDMERVSPGKYCIVCFGNRQQIDSP